MCRPSELLIGGAWVVANVGTTFQSKAGTLCYLAAVPKVGDKCLQIRRGFQACTLAPGAQTDASEWYISAKKSTIPVNQPERLVAWVPPECEALVPKGITILIMRYAWSPQFGGGKVWGLCCHHGYVHCACMLQLREIAYKNGASTISPLLAAGPTLSASTTKRTTRLADSLLESARRFGDVTVVNALADCHELLLRTHAFV